MFKAVSIVATAIVYFNLIEMLHVESRECPLLQPDVWKRLVLAYWRVMTFRRRVEPVRMGEKSIEAWLSSRPFKSVLLLGLRVLYIKLYV